MAMAPTVIAVLVGILINSSRIGDVNSRIGDLRSEMDRRFNDLDRKIDHRFDDIKETWRAELYRVEQVLDARLKHLEER